MSPIQTVHVRIPIYEPDLLLMWLTSQTGKVGYLALLLSGSPEVLTGHKQKQQKKKKQLPPHWYKIWLNSDFAVRNCLVSISLIAEWGLIFHRVVM